MATEVVLSAFVAAASYSRADNVVDATKTVVVTWGGSTQTLTYNAAGQLLNATNPVRV